MEGILFEPEAEEYLSKIFDHINYLRNKELNSRALNRFAGKFQEEYAEWCFEFFKGFWRKSNMRL